MAHTFDNQGFANLVSASIGPGIRTVVTSDPFTYGYASIGIKGIIGDKFKGYINPSFGLASFGLASFISQEVSIVTSNGSVSIIQGIKRK